MKREFLVSILFIVIISLQGFSQSGGNDIYIENNRFEQNQSYNTGVTNLKDASNTFNWTTTPKNEDNEMIFTVNALKNVKAKSCLVIFNATQVGTTAKQADSLLNLRINRFKSKISDLSIKPENIFTDMISLVPLYEFEVEKKLFSTTYNEVPKGFEIQKNIHISIENETIMDKIITAAAGNEIYDLIKVEYFVDNNDEIYTELRNASIQLMRKKIDSYKQLGIDLDTIYHILSEVQSVAYPVDRYKSYQAFSGNSVDAAKSRTTVTTVRKPKTMFYNKLPYHNYDIVINPEILEPVVQFTYNLSIKYTIKDPVKRIENHYKLIRPDGTITTVKVD